MVAATLNASAWMLAMMVLTGGTPGRTGDAWMIVPITFFALVVTLPLGIAYGTVHGMAVAAIRRELATPSWRAIRRARLVGVGVATMGLVALALLACVQRVPDPLVIGVGGLVALGACDVVLMIVEETRLRWWLHVVRTHPGLSLVPPGGTSVPAALAPIEPVDEATVALVYTKELSSYRGLPRAVALLPSVESTS